MSVIKQVIVCDWPGCTASISPDIFDLAALHWVEISPDYEAYCEHPWHACPEHRRRSVNDLSHERQGLRNQAPS